MVLPYINMNPPRVYTCSPSWTPLPPRSPYHPSGSSQCTSPKLPVSCIEPGLAIRFLYDIIHVLLPFSQIIAPHHRVQKTVLYICVSFAVSHTGLSFSSVQFICSVMSNSLRPHELQHARPPCPSPTPGVHSHSCPLSWWCYPATSSSVVPFSSCPHQSLFQWVNSLHEVAKVLSH